MKYINFKRLKFSTILNNINFQRYNPLKILKLSVLKIFDFVKNYKFFYIRGYSLAKFIRLLNLTKYRFSNVNIKKTNFLRSDFLLLHLPIAIIFFTFLYIMIPTFYNYDKSAISIKMCEKQNIKCLIKGKVNYRFYPTPRIKIKNVIIKDTSDGKNNLAKIGDIVLKLSIKNLLSKEKHKFKKAEISNFEINFDLKKSKKYKNTFSKKLDLIPIVFKRGKIILLNGKNYIATIHDVNLILIFKKELKEAKLKGEFLNDKIYIKLNNKEIEKKSHTDMILKMSNLNLLIKSNFFDSEEDENLLTSNTFIKMNKHRFTGIINYKENEININESNLKNIFFDGKVNGKIKLLPYFNFNLDVSLNSLNFTKLYSHFLSLDEKRQKELFKINSKINGKLSLSSNKIYSSYNLPKSFETRIKFTNGNILIEQFLINLGKLGATDLIGKITNDEKFSNLKFESNIFVDNQKKFISKFGIYKKKEIPSNLFISGHFDLRNIKTGFYEISHNEKLEVNDINFIEEEFNDFMLDEGYKNLFYFPKFKEFVKSITSEPN